MIINTVVITAVLMKTVLYIAPEQGKVVVEIVDVAVNDENGVRILSNIFFSTNPLFVLSCLLMK
ncbi:hypothetical protein DERP_014414 [Dermatophagoides pteronyssinus]|uniref:Uncharacterized protein n=1 Tax=Dermatophagoides pteronyssinus TaxID=6956 RepID=A0ABQ8J5W6_DERPT|nr:hypothetical protein DERP_014414 [Dermatophagoides pteronyssinus]